MFCVCKQKQHIEENSECPAKDYSKWWDERPLENYQNKKMCGHKRQTANYRVVQKNGPPVLFLG